MYIRELEENHLEEVAKLEEKTCPKELLLGYKYYKECFLSSWRRVALGVFSKGKLNGYIIALRDDNDNNYYSKSYYISGLVCSNKVHLKMLLLAFLKGVHKYSVSDVKLNFKCRVSSHKLVQKLARLYPFITVDSCEMITNCYENMDMWHYTITLKECDVEELLKTPKELIKYLIYMEDKDSLSDIIPKLLTNRYSKIMGNSFIECLSNIVRNKKYILNHLHQYNLDKWATVGLSGDNIRMIVTHIKPYNSSKHIDDERARLVAAGYEEDRDSYYTTGCKSYVESNDKVFRKLVKNAIITVRKHENTLKYSDSLSSYRRFFMRQIRFLSQNRGFNNLIIYDKYGYKFETLDYKAKHMDIVPYNFSNIFDSIINKAIFVYVTIDILHNFIPKDTIIDVGSLLAKKIGLYFNETNLPSDIELCIDCALKIRKLIGENTASYFIRKISQYDNDFIWAHDWSFIYCEILSAENVKYLTRGACKYLVEDCPFNMLFKINNALKSYTGVIKENKNILKLSKTDIQATRKGLSSIIKRGQYNEAINLLADEQSKLNLIIMNKLSFKNKELQAKATSFIEDMRRYNENIHFSNLVSHFGKSSFKNMVEGKINCIFKTESIKFEENYSSFGSWIKNYLSSQGRNKTTKKIFNAIRKIANVESIYNGNISTEKYDEIIRDLKSKGVSIPKQFLICNEFELRVEKKCSPNFLIAGDASVCCMSFGNENSKTYALEEGFGIINAYYKGRIIANSVIWIYDESNCLVLDNIEVAPNYKKYEILVNLKELFIRITSNLMAKHDLKFAIQGSRYNDLELYEDDSEQILTDVIKARAVSVNHFYTDATYAYKINTYNENKSLAC